MKKNFLFLLCILLMLVFSCTAFASESQTKDTISTNTNTNVNTNIKRWILINIPARSLRVYDNNNCIAMYPVGVGKIVSKTPVGYYKVVEKAINPTWVDPEDLSIVIPSGEDNPLGYRWIGIGGNYGIHGTNKPTSVGHYVSNGCIRMVEENVEKVFEMVEVGTPVQIIYNRLVIDKTPDKRIAYYIYPDGYNMQDLTVDFVKSGLNGYGVGDFVNDESIKKAIADSNGQPNYVAAPINIIVDGVKMPFKAVNYQNLIYVPVKEFANKLNTAVKIENNIAVTSKGSANIEYFNSKPYMHVTDIEKLFDWKFVLNKDFSVMTLLSLTNAEGEDENISASQQISIQDNDKENNIKNNVENNVVTKEKANQKDKKVVNKIDLKNNRQSTNKAIDKSDNINNVDDNIKIAVDK